MHSTNKAHSKAIVYGIHPVLSLLKLGSRKVYEILYTNNTRTKIPEKFLTLARLSTDYEISKILEKKGNDINHQGLLAFCSDIIPKTLKEVNLKKEKSLVVVLDSLTDITNIGTIVRSSAAFSVDFLLYHKTNMPDITKNEIIAKNACGGIEIIPMVGEANLANSIATLKKNDYWIVGLDGSGKQDLKDFAKKGIPSKVAIILGSEGKGMRELTLKLCDFVVKIGISPQMESLNVASAAAIALYELT
jgi:23S rRNA (guanosine2251-2'-O)-methyltransferase